MVIALAISAFIFSIIFWGSIRLLDRRNPRNNFPLAFLLGFIFGIFDLLPGSVLRIFIPLSAISMILNNYYRLSVWKMIIVIFILITKNLFWIALITSG